MTERDLEILLEAAARRVRIQRAFRAAFVALGLSLIAAAVALFAVRMAPISISSANQLEHGLTQAATVAPPLISILVMLAVFLRHKPDLSQVALLLDRRAGSDEHLVTWYEFRRETAAPPQLFDFRAAQRAATLQRVAGFKASALLPIRAPEWSRALFLALLLLCCALLMPPRVERAPVKLPTAASAENNSQRKLSPAQSDGNVAADPNPKIQILNPTDLLKLQLQASDPEVPKSMKEDALKALTAKLGNLPESELAPELRELLNTLRTEVSGEEKEAGKNDSKDGTQQARGNNDKDQTTSAGDAGVPANLPELRQKAISSLQQNFPDVRDQLERYYNSGAQK